VNGNIFVHRLLYRSRSRVDHDSPSTLGGEKEHQCTVCETSFSAYNVIITVFFYQNAW
jgi:hypothetical protein